MRKSEAIRCVSEMQSHTAELTPVADRLGMAADAAETREQLDRLEELASTSENPALSTHVARHAVDLSRQLGVRVARRLRGETNP